MSHQTIQMTDHLYQYMLSVSLREHPVLAHLRRATLKLENHYMQIAPEQGQFMAFLVELIGARKTLELGTFTGYSALTVALALPHSGKVVTCDMNEEWTNIARDFWMQAGVAHKIDLHLGPALNTLDRLIKEGESGAFDFVFIDADKSNYPHYYERCLELVRRGGVIAIDNAFMGGKVADAKNQEKSIQILRNFHDALLRDDRVSLSLLPIADGLTLLRKR